MRVIQSFQISTKLALLQAVPSRCPDPYLLELFRYHIGYRCIGQFFTLSVLAHRGIGRLWTNKALEGQTIVHKQSLAPPMLCLLRGFRCPCWPILFENLYRYRYKNKEREKEWGVRKRLNSEYQRLPLLLKSIATWLLVFIYYSDWPFSPHDLCTCVEQHNVHYWIFFYFLYIGIGRYAVSSYWYPFCPRRTKFVRGLWNELRTCVCPSVCPSGLKMLKFASSLSFLGRFWFCLFYLIGLGAGFKTSTQKFEINYANLCKFIQNQWKMLLCHFLANFDSVCFIW